MGTGQRPRLDVDVLQASVGHAHQAAEHPPLADDDLLVELDPRDGADLAPDQPRGPQPAEHERQGAEQHPAGDEQPDDDARDEHQRHHDDGRGDQPDAGELR